ncbi:MAG: transglutaminase TgpA family protein, partial [Actinomycetota bacterium]
AVVVAAMAPILLPGFGSRGLIDFSTTDDGRVRIDPLVSVQSSLQREDITPVFEVETDTPRYWRMVSLPNFDGRTWSPDPDPRTLDVAPGAALATTTPATAPTETTDVTFRTASELELPWLPLPYPPRSTDAPLDGMRWDPESGSVLLDGGVDAGVTYTATADVVTPTPAQLRAEPFVSDARTARYALAPPNLDPPIADIADRWAGGATNTYDRVIAIQDRFTDAKYGFRYDVDVPGSSSEAAMVEFLTRTKAGFCQQFSSTMAVMLRSLGIPARLAVGFTPGDFSDSADRLTVTTENAHSWVEVWFPSYGWLPFEPTPGRQNPVGYPYIDPSSADECENVRGGFCGPAGRGGQTGGSTVQSDGLISAADRERARPGAGLAAGIAGAAGTFGTANAASDPGPLTARNALLATLVGAAIVLVVVPPLRAWRRRRRLRRAGPEPRSLIVTTYDVFTERAADLGHPRAPGQTIEEYRSVVTGSGALSNGDLERLTTLAVKAAYSSREPAPDDARAATEAADAVLRDLRRSTTLLQRLTGPYRRR